MKTQPDEVRAAELLLARFGQKVTIGLHGFSRHHPTWKTLNADKRFEVIWATEPGSNDALELLKSHPPQMAVVRKMVGHKAVCEQAGANGVKARVVENIFPRTVGLELGIQFHP